MGSCNNLLFRRIHLADTEAAMDERFRTSLRVTWLILSFWMLILPVYLPSYSNPQFIFQNVMSIASVTMFLTSFPMSLAGVPAGYLTSTVLGIDPASIGGQYIALLTFFVMGLIQWFVLVPRLLRKKEVGELLNLFD